MRLKRNRLKPYHLRKAVPKKDSEGNSTIEYAPAESFVAEMWAAGGKLQTEMYGMRLPNIRNLRLDGKYTEVSLKGSASYLTEDGTIITPGDGICLYVDADTAPDYKIVAMYPYRYLLLEVEKI